MRRTFAFSWLGLGAVALALYLGGGFSPSAGPAHGVRIETGPLTVWSVYEGKIEARRVETILSPFNGPATVVDLAPEGSQVRAGDLLVRFDSSQVERDLLKLERDFALARSEWEGLEQATLPLEIQDLEMKLMEAQGEFDAESRYLEDSVELLNEDLVSPQEIVQQRTKVARSRAWLDSLKLQMELTRDFLHPARAERARASLAAAEQELKLAREQLKNCAVLAPADGTVIYQPLHIGTEFRTVRVGDTLYKNQPFMALPDMRDLLAECFVPEAELARVTPGRDALVAPLAYPGLELPGRVESVSGMAQMIPGRPSWQRYFRVRLALREGDPRLLSGMTVQARVRSYHQSDVLLLPRTAVWWEEGEAYCRRRNGREAEQVRLHLGQAGTSYYEVQDGLKAGDFVLLP